MGDINIAVVQDGVIQTTVAVPNTINVSVTIPETPNIAIYQVAVTAGGAAIKPPLVYEAVADNVTSITITGSITSASFFAVWQSTTPLSEYTGSGTIPDYSFKRSGNSLQLGTAMSSGERLYIISDRTLSIA